MSKPREFWICGNAVYVDYKTALKYHNAHHLTYVREVPVVTEELRMGEQEWKSKCFSLEEVVAQRSKEIESLRDQLNEANNLIESQAACIRNAIENSGRVREREGGRSDG